MTQPNNCLPKALEYAGRGWPVLPLHWNDNGRCSCGKPDCGSPGKHPLTAHGVKDASTNEADIRQWFSTWPQANVGIACGNDSKLIVVDLDDASAEKALSALAEYNGGLPSCSTVSTGKGSHRY